MMDVSDVRNAVEAIEIACALGQDIPAPTGTSLWRVAVAVNHSAGGTGVESSEVIHIGVYATLPAAQRALRNWVVQQWNEGLEKSSGVLDGVVAQRKFEEYLNVPPTDESIIAHYFTKYQRRQEIVERITVEGTLPPPANVDYVSNTSLKGTQ